MTCQCMLPLISCPFGKWIDDCITADWNHKDNTLIKRVPKCVVYNPHDFSALLQSLSHLPKGHEISDNMHWHVIDNFQGHLFNFLYSKDISYNFPSTFIKAFKVDIEWNGCRWCCFLPSWLWCRLAKALAFKKTDLNERVLKTE